MTAPEHIAGTTFHGRKGPVANSFRYRVDYLLVDAEAATTATTATAAKTAAGAGSAAAATAAAAAGPWPFRRNAAAPVSLHDSDHGGPPRRGAGPGWARAVLASAGFPRDGRLLLLAQPRVLGHVFNPVAFWLAQDAAGTLRAVIAEVTNTYGDRHSYLCHRDDRGPIAPSDRLTARKVFHVSPFQDVAGAYVFNFAVTPDRVAIRIDLTDGAEGVLATLQGSRRPLTRRALAGIVARGGARRVLGLIHWQALRLWWKGAAFRPRPAPPAAEVSR